MRSPTTVFVLAILVGVCFVRGAELEPGVVVDRTLEMLRRTGGVSDVFVGTAVTNVDTGYPAYSKIRQLVKVFWTNGSAVEIQDGRLGRFMSELNPRNTSVPGRFSTKIRPLSPNPLTVTEAIAKTREFVKAQGADPADVFMDLDPKVVNSPDFFGAEGAIIHLTWFRPGFVSRESFDVIWLKENKELVYFFADHRAFYRTNFHTYEAPLSGVVVKDWAMWSEEKPEQVDMVVDLSRKFPEMADLHRRLEAIRANRKAKTTPPTATNLTHYIVGSDYWLFNIEDGAVTGWTAPDALYANPDVGKLVGGMRAPARLGTEEAIDRVRDTLLKMGHEGLAKWVRATKPTVRMPTVYGNSYLSRVFLYWADNPGRVEDKTLVNVEVDLATGEVKNLRMMQPIKAGQTPK